MIKIIKYGILFFLFIGSVFLFSREVRPGTFSKKEKLANKVIYRAAQHLKQEKLFVPCGSGGRMMHEIRMLALSFFYYKPLTIEQGRELVIRAAKKLTDEINAESRIHPYLCQYPFPPTRTQIRIFVQNIHHAPTSAENISVVALEDGMIEYDRNDPQTNHLKTIYRETYEEGLEKLSHKPEQKIGLKCSFR